ncbi:ATP-binding protein [Nonomuraea sp. NPDC059194]|uniref:ATP-binding protein n=1 Tax=Nonomuraea sp. NPDC059194 TaxID=3346764 RepID=UPI0036AC6E4E
MESNLDGISTAEEATHSFAGRFGLDEEGRYRLGLAVREAVANAVVHGNRYSPDKSIQLRFSFAQGRVTVTVRDEGEGFDPCDVPDPLESGALRGSGRGLLLIRELVDELSVRHRDDPPGTEVRLTVH